VKASDRTLIDSWSLTRWEGDFYFPAEMARRYNLYGIGPEDDDNPLSSITIHPVKQADKSFGCFNSSPLGYGDFARDGRSEILIMGDDIAVLSPDDGKIVFTQRVRINDWLPSNEQENLYDSFGSFGKEAHPQFMSQMAVDRWSGPQPDWLEAFRGYGKLFFGAFSGGENNDLLVWHKFYRSLLVDNELRGFEIISEKFIHYSVVGGVYQLEATDEATIQSWLVANDLTWQKGFPSHSECPGEEGELIPEMHDPLLNDPDVLQ
jgi:hypothetical protein